MNFVENKPLVSLILPTYNVEKYLLQCLISIKKQTYTNIQVIIIIDGSKDNSYDIAKDFCATDLRFSVYWQENAGSGPARNAGIDRATGEYIMFIDPDDWIDDDYVECMVSYQQKYKVDMVIGYLNTFVYDKNDVFIKQTIDKGKEFILFENSENLRNHWLDLVEKGLLGGPHRKLYLSRIIKNNDLRFPPLKRSQDIAFNIDHIKFVNSLCVIPVSKYNYRSVHNSWKAKFDPNYIETIILLNNKAKELAKNWGLINVERRINTIDFIKIKGYLYKNLDNKSALLSMLRNDDLITITKNSNYINLYTEVIRRLFLLEAIFPMRLFMNTLRIVNLLLGRK